MAKKPTSPAPSDKSILAAKPAVASKAPAAQSAGVSAETTTPVRKSVIPKPVAAAANKPATAATPQTFGWHDIAVRAYHISQSDTGGSEDDNWLRAENELKSGKL